MFVANINPPWFVRSAAEALVLAHGEQQGRCSTAWRAFIAERGASG